MKREAFANGDGSSKNSADAARDTHDSLLGLLWAAALLCSEETEAAAQETAAAEITDPVQALTLFAERFAASGRERLDNALHTHMSAVLTACARDMRESATSNDMAAAG